MLFAIQVVLICAAVSFVVTKIYVERTMNRSRELSLTIAKKKLTLVEKKILQVKEKQESNPSITQFSDENGNQLGYQELKDRYSNPNYESDLGKLLRNELFLLAEEREILNQEILYLSVKYKVRLFEV
jgi:hypothetical protein